MLDVPRELVGHLSRLLAAHRRVIGTRKGCRALTCHRQALMVLVWFRKNEDKTLLGAGFGVSRSTAYRYVAEGVAVLSAQAPDLHQALIRVAAEGWSHVILDGKLFRTDRLAETTTSVKGKQIDAWYSGKHRDSGASIQALFRPDGLPARLTQDGAPDQPHPGAQMDQARTAVRWFEDQTIFGPISAFLEPAPLDPVTHLLYAPLGLLFLQWEARYPAQRREAGKAWWSPWGTKELLLGRFAAGGVPEEIRPPMTDLVVAAVRDPIGARLDIGRARTLTQ